MEKGWLYFKREKWVLLDGWNANENGLHQQFNTGKKIGQQPIMYTLEDWVGSPGLGFMLWAYTINCGFSSWPIV